MLMVKVLMEPVLIINGASQLFRAIKFAAVNERGWGEMKAELTAPWRKTANTGNHLKDDNKDFPFFHLSKWLKRDYINSNTSLLQ